VTATDDDVDPLEAESLALAGLSRAAVLGRTALGGRAGRGPLRIGADPDAPWVDRHIPLHAHEAGFDLHAAVHVAAGDRERLAELCRYLCRPPLGQHRLRNLGDGRIAVALQQPWADGTTHLVFTPMETAERLVRWCRGARSDLLLYRRPGSNAPWRQAVAVAARTMRTATPAAASPSPIDAPASDEGRRTGMRPRYRTGPSSCAGR
jgi:hypothetical protein